MLLIGLVNSSYLNHIYIISGLNILLDFSKLLTSFTLKPKIPQANIRDRLGSLHPLGKLGFSHIIKNSKNIWNQPNRHILEHMRIKLRAVPNI